MKWLLILSTQDLAQSRHDSASDRTPSQDLMINQVEPHLILIVASSAPI